MPWSVPHFITIFNYCWICSFISPTIISIAACKNFSLNWGNQSDTGRSHSFRSLSDLSLTTSVLLRSGEAIKKIDGFWLLLRTENSPSPSKYSIRKWMMMCATGMLRQRPTNDELLQETKKTFEVLFSHTRPFCYNLRSWLVIKWRKEIKRQVMHNGLRQLQCGNIMMSVVWVEFLFWVKFQAQKK